jgi:TolA-binding protein
MLWAAWRNSCRSDPARATDEFQKLEVAAQQMPSMVSPQILSDIAKQLHQDGKDEQAIAAWHQLLKWHPNTALKDVALFRLGDAAADGNDMEKAAWFFGRLETECENSALLPEMLLKRSNIYRKNNETHKQIADLTRVAAAKIAPIKVRAQALVELGELKIERQEYANAIVYFQRTYVTCIASREHAARAYERCAFAFEKLSRPDAAAQVYKELIQHPDLVATDAAKECKSRILGTPDP